MAMVRRGYAAPGIGIASHLQCQITDAALRNLRVRRDFRYA